MALRVLYDPLNSDAASELSRQLQFRGVEALLVALPIKQRLSAVPVCDVVLWSRTSALSGELIRLATGASARGALINVLLDKIDVPAPLANHPVIKLNGWPRRANRDELNRLEAAIRVRVGEGPSDPDSTSNGNPRNFNPSDAFVLISYRRDDTAQETGRLHDRLAAEYGPDRVFVDIHDVPLGIDHIDHLRAKIRRCSAVVVMIGPQWAAITDAAGQPRLKRVDDPVRAEVANALQQKHIQVIPVLVQNASMPSAEDLPPDIRLLTRRNWIELRPGQWDEDVQRLLQGLRPAMHR